METEPLGTYGQSSDWISLTPTRRFEIIHIDYGTNISRSTNGNTSYLIAIDVMTKNPIVHPVNQLNNDTIVNFLEEIFAMFGIPRIIISDSSMPFRSQAYSDLLQRHSVLAIRTNCNYPLDNIAERIIGQIRRLIRALSRDNLSWDENLQSLINSALAN